ncbi:MAG: M48 family metallopeptidase [Leptolyngbyaceae cyanobacterium bins.302]|nr:M48 family metallopeptidase [Leptolyngbyaceae cyanobacterium bins.302]
MTFFQHQDRARHNTQKLVGLYLLSIVCIILSIYIALLFTFKGIAAKTARYQTKIDSPPTVESTLPPSRQAVVESRRRNAEQEAQVPPSSWREAREQDLNTGLVVEEPLQDQTQPQEDKLVESSKASSWWQPHLFWLATIPTILVIGLTTLIRLHALKQGGAVVAQELGGRLLLPEMAVSPQEKQLINVVEEMAIAASIPPPFVYILDSEAGINAFAAGSNPKNAVIGVTRGCLEQLNRDELQGVIGHEFSHILNGDMKLNMQLIGVLHGILFIYIFGRLLTYVRSRDSNAVMYLGFALMLIGGIGHFFGRLIQSAVSRQREFLADASAVQFTRNPEGIAGALAKIEGTAYRSYVDAPYAEEMSHLFFGTAFNSNWFADWFATHPPIRQRIKRVEAYWQRNAARLPASKLTSERSQPRSVESGVAMGFAGAVIMPEAVEFPVEASPLQASKVSSSVPAWLSLVPEQFRYIENEETAVALIYALLLEPQNSIVRTIQENGLRKVEASLANTVFQISSDVESVEPRLRMPLIDSVLPILQQCPAARCQHILKTVQALAKADGQWSLFEFAVYILLRERLQVVLPTETQTAAVSPDQLWSDCLMIVSAIAHAGATKSDIVAYAFRSGAYQLQEAKQRTMPDTPVSFQIGDLKQSLDRIKNADSKLKQSLMSACSSTVILDSTVTQSEIELLWAIAITLDCPLPPFLNVNKSFSKGMKKPNSARI